jgi:transposase-like protein
METCNECNSLYNKDTVVIPEKLPDYMCAKCGTQLTKEQVEAIKPIR